MASETHRFIISAEFQPRDAVSQALRAGSDIGRAVQQGLGRDIELGRLDTATVLREAQNLGAKLRAEISRALDIDFQAYTRRATASWPLTAEQSQTLAGIGPAGPASGIAPERLRYQSAVLGRDIEELRQSGVDLNREQINAATALKRRTDTQLRVATAERGEETALQRSATTQQRLNDAAEKLINARLAEAARQQAAAATFARPGVQRLLDPTAEAPSAAYVQRLRAEAALEDITRQMAEGRLVGTRAEATLAAATRDLAAARTRMRADDARLFEERKAAGLQAARALGEQLGFQPTTETQVADTRRLLDEAGLLTGTGVPNKAALARQSAEARLAQTLERVNAGELLGQQALDAVRKARLALDAALRAEEAASRRAAAAAQASAIQRRPGIGGAMDQFALGFRGASDRSYFEQMGQAFKFSVLYGSAYKILFAITQTFQATLQEGIEFQQAVSDLKLASGRAGEEANELADNLGRQATAVGFAPSQGVQVGARALGLYGVAGPQADPRLQERVAETTARVVSQVALTSGKQPADLQANIAAITQAFGGGYMAQNLIADLDAYMSKRFGIGAGVTLGAASEAATVGRAAGFSMEQVFAIAADIQARTGASEAATAGYMAQIFSRAGEGALTGVTSKFGIDQTLTLAEQMKRLADIYATRPEAREEIAAVAGKGKVQNAFIALLQDYSEVLAITADAQAGKAAGAGGEAVNIALGNIGGQIQLTTAAFKDFAGALGQSGFLDVVGAGVVVLRELAQAGAGVLRLWNELPGPLRAAAAAALVFAAAARTGAGAGALGLLRAPAPLAIAGRTAITTGSGAIVPLASRAGAGALAASAGGAALGLLTNPITLAIGGLLAVGALRNSAERLKDAQDTASDTLTSSTLGTASTPEEFRARASELRALAVQNREAASGVRARILGRGPALDQARELDEEARRLDAAAKTVESATLSTASATRQLITDFDPESLSASMADIASAGGTADEQFKALAVSLRGSADAASRAAEAFDAKTVAAQTTDAVRQAIITAVRSKEVTAPPTRPPEPREDQYASFWETGTQPIPLNVSTVRTPEDTQRAYSARVAKFFESKGTEIQERLAEEMAGLTSLGDLTSKEARRIAQSILDDPNLNKELAGLPEEELRRIRNQIARALRGQAVNVQTVLDGAVQLSGRELTEYVNQLVATSEAAISRLPETDYAGRINRVRRRIARIIDAIAHAPAGATPETQRDLQEAQGALAEAQFNQLEAMRRAAQHNARSMREVREIGRSFLVREIRAAVSGRNADLLARIIGQAGDGAIVLARQAIDAAVQTAGTAIDTLSAMQRAAGALIPMAGGIINLVGRVAGFGEELGRLKKLRDSLAAITPAGKEGDVYSTGRDANLAESLTKEAEGAGETALERAAAAAAARAARSESPIAAARASILSARAALAKAKKGTVEYYNALAQFYDARNQLTDAILDYRHNLDLLGIDITDPVAMANAAVREATRKLRSDRGKGADVIAADRVALREAQAQREATAFETRLQTVQTAEQLGRISHSQYIRYLENESRRLNRIKDRTYQQQQQLNQIDQLLQEAAQQMEGQWNFGNIKLPTPYQVRRYIAANDPVAGSQDRGRRIDYGGVTNFDNKIYINGAEIQKVRRVVEDVLAKTGRRVTTSPRRRV